MKQGIKTQATSQPKQFYIAPLGNGAWEIAYADNVIATETMRDSETVQVWEYDDCREQAEFAGYDGAVSALIGLKYATSDEIAVTRKGMDDRNDAGYIAYLAYVKACKDYAREYFGIELSAEQKEQEENAKYIPSAYTSLVAFAQNFLSTAEMTDDGQKIAVSGLYQTWTLGKYEVGDIRNAHGQTWECFQAHDNATYPDINPDNQSTWRTFWRPLHGKSKETARPWAQPTNATDIYKTGEYMIWTDGAVYRCKQDTNFSPEEYASAWEVVG